MHFVKQVLSVKIFNASFCQEHWKRKLFLLHNFVLGAKEPRRVTLVLFFFLIRHKLLLLTVWEVGLRLFFERDFKHALSSNNRYKVSVNLHLNILVPQFILVNHCVVHLTHRDVR